MLGESHLRHSRNRPNVELLAIVVLVVGGLLGGILWMMPTSKTQAIAPPIGVSDATEAPKKSVVAILPAAVTVAVAMPRSCAKPLNGTRITDTSPNISDDTQDDVRLLAGRGLAIPVVGIEKNMLYDSFTDGRGARKHEAIDIHAPRGTPVIAAGDGCVVKLFRSIPGGITLYQFDPEGNFAYYYAHLDRYADDVKEGSPLARGDVLGYVGTTGNAPPNAPHLHFAIFRLGPEKRWWQGTPVNPYAVFTYR